jgi:hypothetical protein
MFMRNMRGHVGRSPLFYENVRNISNTYWVSNKFYTSELIAKSKYVATITGTAALEASLSQKIAIIFGDTWHAVNSNVKSFTDIAQFSDLTEAKAKTHSEIKEEIFDFVDTYALYGVQNTGIYKKYSKIIMDPKFKTDQNKSIFTVIRDTLNKI